jgi:GNAT superfamily N-acetyltransferase
MEISYEQTRDLAAADYIGLLHRSGLAERRPVGDKERIGRMIRHANLIVVARDAGTGLLVGVARSLTDFSYCCYLSDLAVDKGYQGRGIGRQLIEETRKAAGPEAMCLLVSAPDAIRFYEAIGMPRAENAFLYRRSR